MQLNIFIYSLLYNLYNNGITAISLTELDEIYEQLIEINCNYNDELVKELTSTKDSFINKLIFVFTRMELGIYDKKNLIFADEELMFGNLYNHIILRIKNDDIKIILEKAEIYANHIIEILLANKKKK